MHGTLHELRLLWTRPCIAEPLRASLPTASKVCGGAWSLWLIDVAELEFSDAPPALNALPKGKGGQETVVAPMVLLGPHAGLVRAEGGK